VRRGKEFGWWVVWVRVWVEGGGGGGGGGGAVQSTTGSRGVRISGSNDSNTGYNMF